MNKKRSLFIAACMAFSALAAHASWIDVVFDNPDQTGAPGQTLQFYGTITNTSDADVFLYNDTATLDSQFLLNDPYLWPAFLAAGDNSGDIELFDYTLPDPFGGTLDSPYAGTYQMVGGLTDQDQEPLLDNPVSFSVTVSQDVSAATPEPATWMLMGGILLSFAAARRLRGTRSGSASQSFTTVD